MIGDKERLHPTSDIEGAAEDVPPALYRDGPVDLVFPARTTPHAIPSGGLNLNAVMYSASGRGLHPTVLLLHGLPGNEQNVALAQSMRRAGWNVLAIHYRGSWGGPGIFTLGNCIEDAAAAVEWLRCAAIGDGPRVDARRIVVVGHSMGGFVAAHTVAQTDDLLGAAILSGVDLGLAFGKVDCGPTKVDENVGITAGLHILKGTSAEALAHEARTNADRWCLTNYAANLASRPMLVVTGIDGFSDGSDQLADGILALGSKLVTREHFSADHSYSAHRIQLQAVVLRWLLDVNRTSSSVA